MWGVGNVYCGKSFGHLTRYCTVARVGNDHRVCTRRCEGSGAGANFVRYQMARDKMSPLAQAS